MSFRLLFHKQLPDFRFFKPENLLSMCAGKLKKRPDLSHAEPARNARGKSGDPYTGSSEARSDLLLQTVLENTLDPVYIKDKESRVVMCNQALEKVVGKPMSEIVGKTDSEYYQNLEVGAKLREHDLLVMNTGKSHTLEETINSPEGFRTYISVKNPWRNRNGEVIGIVGISHDITARKQMEKSLEESEKRYRELVKYAPVGIYEVDFRTKKLISVNEAMAILTGYSTDELLSMDVMELLDDESKILFQSRIERMFGGIGEKENVEYNIVKKDGGIIRAVLNIKFKTDEKGVPVGAMVVGYDVTEARDAERILNESRQKYQSLIETNDDFIWETDINGNYTYCSPQMEKLWGLKPEEMIGKAPFEIMTEKYRGRVKEFFKRLAVHPVPFKGVVTTSVVKDNRTVYVDTNGVPFYDSKGKLAGFRGISRDITERMAIEESLRKSEKKYMELVTNARSIIIQVNTSGMVTFMNEFGLSFFGFGSDEILGRLVSETIVPRVESTGRDLKPMLEEIFSDPDRYSININENVKKNGERVWIEWYNKSLHDDDGNRIGHMAIGIDITGRVKAEESLKLSEERLRSVLDAAKESIYMFDREGMITLSNATGLKRFQNIPEKDFVGHSITEFLDYELAANRKKKLDEVLLTGRELDFEDERNGRIYHNTFMPVFRDNEVINVATFSSDITERIAAEKKLANSQEKLRIAVENGNIGIWEWDMKSGAVAWDERTEIMFGLRPGTFGNTFDAFMSLVNEEDIPHIQKAITDTLDRGIPFETIFRLSHKGGKPRYISSKALLNRDNEGRPLSMTGVSIDVTALKEGTETLILKLNEDLLRSNRDLQSFAYVASHDLQEPLRTITSFTQLLSHHYKDTLDERAREYIEFIVEGAVRMYDLLNALLEYSRIHSKGKTFQRVELNKVLAGAVKNLAFSIKESNAKITSGKLPVVHADEGQMVQLFQNLLSNSIKFSTDTPRIHVSSKTESGNYVISVRDEGMGIEPQYFERIFQIFQRLHTREQYEGTGIGLAICKRIVERHGGSIWVESEPGKGSTFVIKLSKERTR